MVGTLLLGRFAVRLLFGPDADLITTARLAVLALAAAVQATILLVQPATGRAGPPPGGPDRLGRRGSRLRPVFLLPVGPLDRGTIAQLVGPVVTLSVHLLLVRTRGRSVRCRCRQAGGASIR